MVPFLTTRSRIVLASVLAVPFLLIGCKSAPAPAPAATAAENPPVPKPTYPARPTVPLPAFKVFKHINSSFTLTIKPDATDDEIESLIWQLHDASRTRTLNSIKISQKAFDTDGDSVNFHIYRGTKCATEKFVPEVVCGGGYHASGDYTYTTVNKKPWDTGTLLHDEDHRVRLWDPEAPYTPASK
ncbi:MAG TPA: hypothetical protein VGC07_08815 [Granulicella sp.]